MESPEEPQSSVDNQASGEAKKVIFLSDTHIGTSGSRYSEYEQSFMKHARQCDHIVLNGDIFDFGYFDKNVEARLRSELEKEVGKDNIAEGAIVKKYVAECLERLDNFIQDIHDNGKKGAKIHFVIGNSELVREFYDGLDALASKHLDIFEWDKHSIMFGGEKKTLIVHGDEEVRQLNEVVTEARAAVKNILSENFTGLRAAVRDILKGPYPEGYFRGRGDKEVPLEDLDQARPEREKRELRNRWAVPLSAVFQPMRGVSDELIDNIKRNIEKGGTAFSCTENGETQYGNDIDYRNVTDVVYGHTHVATRSKTVFLDKKSGQKVQVHNPGSPTEPGLRANHGHAVLVVGMNPDGSLGKAEWVRLERQENSAPILAEPITYGGTVEHADVLHGLGGILYSIGHMRGRRGK